MSEYELISILTEQVSAQMTLVQWWVGITFGILIAVHVIGGTCNGYIATLLIALYTTFTFLISTIGANQMKRVRQVNIDLNNLQDQGSQVSTITQHLANMGGPPSMVICSSSDLI